MTNELILGERIRWKCQKGKVLVHILFITCGLFLFAPPAYPVWVMYSTTFLFRPDITCPPPLNRQKITVYMYGAFTAEGTGNHFDLIDEDNVLDDLLVGLSISDEDVDKMISQQAPPAGVPARGWLILTYCVRCDPACEIEGVEAEITGFWVPQNPPPGPQTVLPVFPIGPFPPRKVEKSGEDCAELAIELVNGGHNYKGGDMDICCISSPPGNPCAGPTVPSINPSGINPSGCASLYVVDSSTNYIYAWYETPGDRLIAFGRSALEICPASNTCYYVTAIDPVTGCTTNSDAVCVEVLVLQAAISGPQLVLSFQSVSNALYTIEYTPSLPPVQWNTIASGIVGTGETITHTTPMLGGSGFYRAHVQPPAP